MILAITAVHLSDIAMAGLLVVGLGWLFHLGRRYIDLWIDRMHTPKPAVEYARFDESPIEALANGLRDKPIAPEDEPSWPGKAPFNEPADPSVVPAAVAQPLYVGPTIVWSQPRQDGFPDGDPARVDLASVAPETDSETSGRHARIDADDTPTGLLDRIGQLVDPQEAADEEPAEVAP